MPRTSLTLLLLGTLGGLGLHSPAADACAMRYEPVMAVVVTPPVVEELVEVAPVPAAPSLDDLFADIDGAEAEAPTPAAPPEDAGEDRSVEVDPQS